MTTYRITFFNIAFAPRPSISYIEADSAAGAFAQFWARTNPGVVLRVHSLESRSNGFWYSEILPANAAKPSQAVASC